MSDTALRLAERIDFPSVHCGHEAAAELRRLHALNAELVEALRMSRDALNQMWQSDKARPALVVAERALAKVEASNGS